MEDVCPRAPHRAPASTGRAAGGRKVRHKRSVQDSRLREPNFGYHVNASGRSTSRPFAHVPRAYPRRESDSRRHARGAFQDFSPSTCTHQYHHCIIHTHHSCAPSCYILPHTEHNLPSPRSFRSRVPIKYPTNKSLPEDLVKPTKPNLFSS